MPNIFVYGLSHITFGAAAKVTRLISSIKQEATRVEGLGLTTNDVIVYLIPRPEREPRQEVTVNIELFPKAERTPERLKVLLKNISGAVLKECNTGVASYIHFLNEDLSYHIAPLSSLPTLGGDPG